MAETENPLERFVVVASRQWHKPLIRVSVDDTGIAVSVPLQDFLKALAVEMGYPGAYEEMQRAAQRIVDEAQAATSRVM